MNLSDDTLEVLDNFSDINSGITVRVGQELKTISPMKNIFGTAKISENFDKEFSIYDLSEFLATLSLFDAPTYEFGEKEVVVSEGGNKARYVYADPSMIITPEKDITMPNPEIVFELDNNTLSKVQKAANVLSLPDLVLESDGTIVLLTVRDRKLTDSSNEFGEKIADGDGSVYSMNFKIENLKILDDDYTVYVSSKGISHFVSKNKGVEYFIALEPDSKYGA